MIILGIESSCDETAASVAKYKNNKIKILSNIVSSQIDIHKKYGGVVPEVAAREHVLNILPVINDALKDARIKKQEASKKIDAIAVTVGPGLVTSLQTGVETAKSLSYAWNIPIISINHIEGHIAANFINRKQEIKYPAVILTVSGGHTMLVLMTKSGKYKTLGETRDDAAGEAFDKAAKLMKIGYPGGPIISKIAKNTTTTNITLPKPMMHSDNFEFSFSGLKTAIRYKLEKDPDWRNKIPEYCFEFQRAVIDVLIHKTLKAAKEYNAQSIMLAGGVSANTELRKQLKNKISLEMPHVEFSMPEMKYTTDNAAMIAAAGCLQANKKQFTNWKDIIVNCNKEL